MAAKSGKRKVIAIVACILVVALVVGGIFIKKAHDKKKTYESAVVLANNGEYDSAVVLFTELGDYGDSLVMLTRISADRLYDEGDIIAAYDIYAKLGSEYQTHEADYAAAYDEAEALATAGRYAWAAEAYRAIGNYKDSADKVQECLYLDAGAASAAGNYAAAKEKFLALGEYSDSAVRAVQAEADRLYARGDLTGAYAIYQALDAAYQTHEADYAAAYDAAGDLAAAGDYAAAAEAYKAIENYKDSADRIPEMYHALGEQKLAAGDADGAKAAYTKANGYGDSAEKLAAIDAYREARKLEISGKYIGARDKYNESGIMDSLERAEACCQTVYDRAEELYRKGDIAGAHDAYVSLGDYSDSAEKVKTIEDSYQAAQKAEQDGNYEEAIAGYLALGNYADAEARYASLNYDCAMREWADGDKEGAEARLAAIGDYSDAAEQLAKLRLDLAEDSFASGDYGKALVWYALVPQTDDVKALEYALAQAAYDAGDYGAAVTGYEALGYYELAASRLPVARYAYAAQLFDAGEYVKAAEQFTLLGDTSDAKERVKECNYQEGLRLLENEEYDEAKKVFEGLGAYSNAADMAKECDYRKACVLMDDEKYTEASSLFRSIALYSDSAQKANECDYRLAQEKLDNGEYAAAEDAFRALGSYSDSAEKTKLCVYRQAEIARDAGRYEDAENKFTSLSGYEDSADQAKECHYRRAEEKYAAGDYAAALALYRSIDYEDSAEKCNLCNIALGDAALRQAATMSAAHYYCRALPNEEAREKLFGIGKDYASMNMYPEAIACLYACGEYEPAEKLLGEMAELLEANAQPVPALICYALAGEEEKAAALWETVAPTDVKAYAGTMDAELAPDMAKLTRYRYAAYLNAAGKYDEAYAIYATITGYADVDSIIETDDNISAAAAAAAAAARAAFIAQFDVGKTVTMGTWAGEEIEWIVLAANGDDRVLIAKYGIEAKAYNEEYTSVTWETCSLRKWLNGEFYESAFTEDEKKLIAQTTVKNDDNPKYGTEGGSDTQDYVYLLSIDEVNRYFADDDARVCYPTSHAEESGAWTYSDTGAGVWWLRSPGFSSNDAARVSHRGGVNDFDGYFVYLTDVCARPVVAVRLSNF